MNARKALPVLLVFLLLSAVVFTAVGQNTRSATGTLAGETKQDFYKRQKPTAPPVALGRQTSPPAQAKAKDKPAAQKAAVPLQQLQLQKKQAAAQGASTEQYDRAIKETIINQGK
jgi:hypothetical protein